MQRLVDAVEPLVGQQVVDHLPGDQALVGEQLANDRLELAAGLRVGKAAQVSRVDLAPEPGRGDQRQRPDARRVSGRGRERDGRAQRMPGQVRALGADRVEHADDGVGQQADRAVADVLGRGAVPGQVQRVHPVLGGQRRLQEQPRVAVAAVAVDEQHHVAVLPGPDVADLPAADLGGLDHWLASGLVGHAGVDDRAGLLRGRVQVGVAHAGGGDQRDRPADRHVLAHLRDDPPDGPGVGRLQGPGDLVGLDVREVVADADLVALGHRPVGDLAELHRQAPLRHRHRDDPVIGHRVHPVTVLTAFTTRCASGM